MGYDNMMFLSPHSLSFQDNCLVIDGRKERSLEDINTIVLENRETQISTYLLSEFGKYNITCIFCDEKHNPCNILVPINDNVRHVNRLRLQVSLKVTAKKDIWKRIITKKILNQSKCLALFNIPISDKLEHMSKIVKTNDNTYMESNAAKLYFPALFEKGFNRRKENTINAALNYGYAIIRSIIARSLVAYGFEASVGIFHCNTFNAFNLADDFIEPFRPMVDAEVKEMLLRGELEKELSTNNKQKLISLQNKHIVFDKEIIEIRDAINKMIISYIKCCEKNISDIELPDFLYE